MLKFPSCILLLATAAGLLNTDVFAALEQGSESNYLANFELMQAASYSVIEDEGKLPPNLVSECKNRVNAPVRDVIVQSETEDVTSSTVSQQCGDDSVCIIPFGTTFQVDTSINLGALVVRGVLEWNDETQQETSAFLCAGYVAVEGNGKWVMDIQAKDAFIYIKDNGATHMHLRSRAFGSAAMSTGDYPIIDINGRELVRTWSLLAEPLNKEQDKIKLMHDPKAMGWRVGDRLAISPTEKRATGTGEDFTVIAINEDGTVQLERSAQYDHAATFIPGSRSPALLSSEVINLSRNIVITGDDFKHVPCDPNFPEAVPGEQTSVTGCRCASFRSQCTLGLHSAIMHGGEARISNTRIERCGQRGVEGKYCLHFHKLHDCPTCLFKNNAIENSHQRGIIVHSTHSSQVEQNVLYNVRGAGIYIEDGNEMHNDIKYNVVICPFPFGDKNLHGCTLPGTSNRIADTSDNQAGIYSRASTNNLVGNRVANSFNAMLLDAGSIGRGESYGKVCEADALIGRVEGNTFHGNGRFGTYTLGGNYAKNTDQSILTDGHNVDKSLCSGFDDQGHTRGNPGAVVDNTDYGNSFVGHYEAGEIQYSGHHSYGNNELLYWKETKNFDNGCSAHITGGSYAVGNLALPDQATFIIERTTFGVGVSLEANHHCNVGSTGVLCQPQYIFHDISWNNPDKSKKWIWFQSSSNQYEAADHKHGGIFSLSPPNADAVMSGEVLDNSIFPPGYISLVSNRYLYLLDLPGDVCSLSNDLSALLGLLYSDGILCKVPLRSLKIYTRGLISGSAPKLMVEMWYNKGGVESQTGTPDASQLVGFHQVGPSRKQGYSFPIVPGTEHSYRLSFVDGSFDTDVVVEFSDPILGNRFGSIEYTNLSMNGELCGVGGRVSSHHDRRFMWSGDEFMADEAWGNTGACAAEVPPDSPKVDCSKINDGVLPGLECPELCNDLCEEENSYCDCGSATCKCKPGFYGDDCSQDLCSAAGCEHGKCAAKFLGGELPLTTNSCICKKGWAGDRCQFNPCQTLGKMCSGHGTCVAAGDTDAKCLCDDGFSGFDCETSCDGVCIGLYPYGCATSVTDAVQYGCHPSGGCSYIQAGGQYPYSGFCTYKQLETISGPNTAQPTSSSPTTAQPISSPISPKPTPQPPTAQCDGVCIGSYPYGCATHLSGVIKYGCHPAGGCSYLQAGGEYPYAGFCTYKEVITPTDQPTSSQPSTAKPVTAKPTSYPLSASPTTQPPTAQCNGVCIGSYPYGCATNLSGVIKYGCHPAGGCSYLQAGGEYPYAGFCTYKEVINPTDQPTSSQPSTAKPVTAKPTSYPLSASPTTQPPTAQCNGVCIGSYPYGCATNLSGVIKYGCHPAGGCSYLQAGGEYPYAGFCTYKEVITPTDQPTSSQPSTAKPMTAKPTSRPLSASPTPQPTRPPSITPTSNPTNIPSNPPTNSRNSPTSHPINPPTVSYCGCPRCTTTIWNTMALNGNEAYTCGARITHLQTTDGGSYSEVDACKKVAGMEFPNACGPECDPDRCNYQLGDPDPSMLLWSDEFDVDGSPDSSSWDYDLGDGCNVGICNWGNGEQAYYTNSLNNVYVSNGSLKIVSKKESGYSLPYTSTRLVTRGKHSFKYGRIQFRANLSKCKALGTWPALWMLPEFKVYGGWPKSGEIDVMETVGHDATRFFGTVHTETKNGEYGQGSSILGSKDDWHIFEISWEPNRIQFSVDSYIYFEYLNTGSGPSVWPFDQEFHLIINVAVGGTWGGQQGIDSTAFEGDGQILEVDWVRVYGERSPSKSPSPPPSITNCGCSTCTKAVWNSPAVDAGGSSTCGARVIWLQSPEGGSLSEFNACQRVAGVDFPNGPCGPHCDPTKCTSQPVTAKPTPSSSSVSPTTQLPTAQCDGVCVGTYPYGCTTNLGGVVKYGCHPAGGCNYLQAGGQYPYAGFCTYKEVLFP